MFKAVSVLRSRWARNSQHVLNKAYAFVRLLTWSDRGAAARLTADGCVVISRRRWNCTATTAQRTAHRI
eukprot:6909592-Prymnesium_polylepis.1